MTSKCFAVLLGFVLSGTVAAQPSGGFFLFKNMQSGQVVCAQMRISPEWVQQAAGPFKDPDCKIPEEPKSESKDLPAVPPGLSPKK
ncbi:hypothetical protein AWV80_17840 [Cupriavidus sp. UYMU48A]|nr:hypothetical protein AWV80_17840 [Cupriavidus sp. UYMU48A]